MEKIDYAQLCGLISDELWSNAACCGYVVMACEYCELPRTQTNELLSALKVIFDSRSVEDAKDIYMRY